MVIVVRDPGPGFDPGAVADPLEPANRLKPSGRGIFLIKALMDHVQFADGGREVQMRKRKAPDLLALPLSVALAPQAADSTELEESTPDECQVVLPHGALIHAVWYAAREVLIPFARGYARCPSATHR